MKKRTIGVFTLLIIILGSCATITVATPITTLGNINYYNTQDNFCINEKIPGNANLTLIYSEIDENGLKIDKIWYDSFTDNTTYKFTTQKISVEWWFTPNTREFVYIDTNNNNLYRIEVNYTKIDIPENPYEQRHRQLTENYTSIWTNYNLTNETLANISFQFNELDELYNLTMQQFNITLGSYQNASENLTDLKKEFDKLDEKYNTTYTLWDSAVSNVTTLDTTNQRLTGDYEKLEKDHSNLSGAIPWYIILAILGTFLITYIYTRRKAIFDKQPETTNEIVTGYTKTHNAIDKHILSRLRPKPKTTEGKIEEIPSGQTLTPKEELNEPPKKLVQDDAIQMIHEKIDENTRAMTTRFDKSFKTVHGDMKKINERIDDIIQKENTPIPTG